MSDNNQNITKTESIEHDIPRMEPWLAVTLLSIVPGVGLFILPSGVHIPVYVLMAVLMVAGLGMFLKGEINRRR